MIYLSSFALSDKKVKNPNLYPYSVFQDKDCDHLCSHLSRFCMEITDVESQHC